MRRAAIQMNRNGSVRLARPRKYRNEPITVDSILFASRAEARRYNELKLLKLAGEIRDLELQPKYELIINGELVCTYTADFRYRFPHSDAPIVEDCKSKATRTPQYRIKVKLLKALTGITIKEVF